MRYIDLINNSKFNELIERYLNNVIDGIDAKEYFKHFTENLKNQEIIVPVLGIQGAGKSSFLNSILMDDNILPTDVDETTCVPVEVRYGTNTSKAEIYFHEKEKELVDVSTLEKYVHNDYNPANELRVSKIVLYNESEILKNNVVLVDLPGVGSLTPENQKTTLDYVEKLVTAIFMIRTVPPITRTEKNFINALWPKLSNTIFVQNKWNDESNEEAEDAKEHNQSVLQSISNSHNDERDINVNIVNVYEAIQGKFLDNDENYKNSGILNVIKEIKNISTDYNKDLESTLNMRVEGILNNITSIIEDNKRICNNQNNQNELEKEKRIIEIKQILKENKKNIRQIKNYVYDEMDIIISRVLKDTKENIENTRTELRRMINTGIVDGELLSNIYKEEAEKAINNIMENLLMNMEDLTNTLNEKLGLIRIKGFDGKYENRSSFNKKEAFKFEKAVNPILSIGGGIAAVFIVGGGIPGIIIGAGIGIICSIFGGLINKGIKNVRVKRTIEDLEPIITQLKKDLDKQIVDSLRGKRDEIESELNKLKDDLENECDKDIEKIEEQYSGKFDEKNIAALDMDLEDVKRMKEAINE
ncbi:dynamin family protein [Clostridium manihotivorum]|uniref:Dynamin family protein n=1 Tax=Clostridium manihotivorum TaxID=2320868 RepID=A0A410DQJ6_9CLOT|nr:dynamin family protein [Clostridium manihotivorum]QAA31322.1 dynamin family protein [Clostridium manihotivorum]